MTTIDWLVIAVYAAAMLAVGWYYSRQNETADDYHLGGRRMNPLAIGLSLFATLTSALSEAEWRNLWFFERQFGIRQVDLYSYPSAVLGLQSPTGTTAACEAVLTPQGQTAFPYLASRKLTIVGKPVFLAHRRVNSITPLLCRGGSARLPAAPSSR